MKSPRHLLGWPLLPGFLIREPSPHPWGGCPPLLLCCHREMSHCWGTDEQLPALMHPPLPLCLPRKTTGNTFHVHGTLAGKVDRVAHIAIFTPVLQMRTPRLRTND